MWKIFDFFNRPFFQLIAHFSYQNVLICVAKLGVRSSPLILLIWRGTLIFFLKNGWLLAALLRRACLQPFFDENKGGRPFGPAVPLHLLLLASLVEGDYGRQRPPAFARGATPPWPSPSFFRLGHPPPIILPPSIWTRAMKWGWFKPIISTNLLSNRMKVKQNPVSKKMGRMGDRFERENI